LQSQFLAEFLKIINHINEASDGKHTEGFPSASYFCSRTTVCSFDYYTEKMYSEWVHFSVPSVIEEIVEAIVRYPLRSGWKGTASSTV